MSKFERVEVGQYTSCIECAALRQKVDDHERRESEMEKYLIEHRNEAGTHTERFDLYHNALIKLLDLQGTWDDLKEGDK